MTTDTQIRRLIFKNGWLRSHFTKYELFRSLDDEDKTGGTYWKLNLSCSSNEHEIVDITFAVVTQIITFTGLKQSFIC